MGVAGRLAIQAALFCANVNNRIASHFVASSFVVLHCGLCRHFSRPTGCCQTAPPLPGASDHPVIPALSQNPERIGSDQSSAIDVFPGFPKFTNDVQHLVRVLPLEEATN
jgi:hypothetical protein